MKTVTVHTPGAVQQKTLRALHKYVRPLMDVELIEIEAGDPLAYRDVLAKFWREGESFMVVEPDIVIRPDVVTAYTTCRCNYGCFPYPWLTDVGPALGCTWFHTDFIAKYPGAMQEVGSVSWKQLDVVLMRHILARSYGEQPHVHLPPVEHLNPDKQLLPEANPEPLMEVPHW